MQAGKLNRGSPGDRLRRGFQPIALIGLSLGGLAVLVQTGCATSPVYRDLSLGAAGPHSAPRPTGLESAEALLRDCVGVLMAPYFVRFGCPNGQEVLAVGFEEQPGTEGCKRVLGDADVKPGPDWALPAGALAFEGPRRTTICAPAPSDGLVLYTVSAIKAPNPGFGAKVLPALAFDGVPAGRLMSRQPETLDVFGRPIRVPRWCRLMGPRNLACGNDGQVSWTVHDSIEGAQQHQDDQLERTIESGSKVLARSTVDCTFEGMPTQCEWLKYRLPLPFPNSMWEPDVLIAWYATSTVRGVNVQLVCSYFADTVPKGQISRLCGQFLEFLED